MKWFSAVLALLLSVGASLSMANDPLGSSTQVIVVTTPGWDAVQGRLRRYQRQTPAGEWRPVGVPVEIVVGKSGMGWGAGVAATSAGHSDPTKNEGDGRSPAGVFLLGAAFGEAPQPLPGLRMPYLALSPSIECVDDIGSKYYNRIVDRAAVTADWSSSEHMLAVGEPYKWGIVVGHNGGAVSVGGEAPMPGVGSCVFLHIWGGPNHGTAGCTAMSSAALQELLTWLDPKQKPLLVELPAAQYARMRGAWGLPAAPLP